MKKGLLLREVSFAIIFSLLLITSLSTKEAYCKDYNNYITTDDDNIYTVPVALYDYRSDSEIETGNLNNYYKGENQAFGYNHYEFEQLNAKISNYSRDNGIEYPLYFGDFNKNCYSLRGQALNNFHWSPNRANNNDMTAAVQGLVDNRLSNSKITQNGTEMPYFNENFLKNTTENNRPIGRVVNTKFPFRKTQYGEINYYEFDSTNGKDNVWLDNSGNLQYSNNASTNGVWDANHTMVTKNSRDNIGFFPFNNRNTDGVDDSRSKLNFGFGLRMDINFNIPKGGIITDSKGNKNDVIFEFTGDDDVWVFIDDKLVLDIGGDHKKSCGLINFNSSKSFSKVNRIVDNPISDNLNQSVKNGSEVKLKDLGLDFSDETKEHKLSFFYMERGMVESNMKIRYNFRNNNLINTSKKVDYSRVNQGLQNKIKNLTSNDNFNFTFTTFDDSGYETSLDNTHYLKNNSTNLKTSNGKFMLMNNENVRFLNSIEFNSNYRIQENYLYGYETKINVGTNTNNTGGFSNYTIFGTDTGPLKMGYSSSLLSLMNLDFINTIKTGTLNVSKEVDKYVENRFDDFKNDVFTFQVKFKNLFGRSEDSEYSTYDFIYSVDGGEERRANDGKITLKAGEKAAIKGIPIETDYIIEEVNTDSKYKLKDSTNATGTIESDVDYDSTFINGPANEVYDLIIRKTIDDKYYRDNEDFSCNEKYSSLTDVKQTFLFVIKQYDKPCDDENRKLLNEFNEVISFNNDDGLSKEKVIKNLPKGYYEVVEDTEWSWKYECKGVNIDIKGSSKTSNNKVENIDLGYNIIKTPTVEFENLKKYSDIPHNEIPEGDSDIETNILIK